MPETTPPPAQPGLEEFEAEALAFLEANSTRRGAVHQEWGEGDDTVALFEEKSQEEEDAEVAAAKSWKAKSFDAGFGWITGPPELGGRGLSGAYERAYRQLEQQYEIPPQTCFGIGLGMVAPTILAHAQPHIRERYLAPMYRGDVVGCQLFSEPVAGSDLASIQTRAERDGDEWIVTGQKLLL